MIALQRNIGTEDGLKTARFDCVHFDIKITPDFTGTKRMVGRVTASQIASASAASFFCRFK